MTAASTREVRREMINERCDVVLVRSALGQVAEYDVYLTTIFGTQTYLGGGDKRFANNLFNSEVKRRKAAERNGT